MTRATFGRDAAQCRDLGLSWADGDRIVTIPNYPCDSWPDGVYTVRPMVYWSVQWRDAQSMMLVRSGVAATERLARAAIAAIVRA